MTRGNVLRRAIGFLLVFASMAAVGWGAVHWLKHRFMPAPLSAKQGGRADQPGLPLAATSVKMPQHSAGSR